LGLDAIAARWVGKQAVRDFFELTISQNDDYAKRIAENGMLPGNTSLEEYLEDGRQEKRRRLAALDAL
jgi:hypothetical protein